MGHVVAAGAGMNPARQTIATAAQAVWLGHADCMIAGGMENVDQGPCLPDRARWGCRMGPGSLVDATLRDGLNDAFPGEHSGRHTDDLVARRQISRREQDARAARSQQRFEKAQADGLFRARIVPVRGGSGERAFDTDEANRAGVTARLPHSMARDGLHGGGGTARAFGAATGKPVPERDAVLRVDPGSMLDVTRQVIAGTC